ncbi:MAG: hypothetical protein OEZ13_04045 [Spirochaetia bacterium]|nr:hypothetical protein [Spirochaetia bacterium]
MITIAPTGGLANRMRVIDSAIELNKKLNSKLIIKWHLNKELNCRFENLFIKPHAINQISNIKENIIITFIRKFINKFLPFLYRLKYDIIINQKKIDTFSKECLDNIFSNTQKHIFITTYSRFFPSDNTYKEFHPVNVLKTRIINFNNKKKPIIGLHIRRTDHIKSINKSPTEGFIEIIKQKLKENKKTKFFLSTDSKEEEILLLNIFPENIVVNKKRSLNRNKPEAIEDALVDLYCLSKCEKLYGSYWSSFTQTAADIGKIDFKVVVK